MAGELIHVMLEPGLAEGRWQRVATYLQSSCDRFWIHWWFRPPNDKRSLWEQLGNQGGRPAPEPMPDRAGLALGLLAPFIDEVRHSWICPNGAATSGCLSAEVLGLLLARTALAWWDLHLISGGVTRFVATDGGSEQFAWVSEADMAAMLALGLPQGLFRIL